MQAEPAARSVPGLFGLVIGIPAARRAAETARLVERWGGIPLVGPTVEEVEVGNPEPVLEATRTVIAGPAAWSVHLTGVGTSRWFRVAGEHGLLPGLIGALSAARIVARGAKAAAALKSFDLAPAWMPGSETSREIAEWMSGQMKPGELVALQRHGEVVPDLSDLLAAAGARLVDVVTYHWQIPQNRGPAEELVRALVGGRVHGLVITSAPQVRHLFEIAAGLGAEEALRGALGDRVFLAAVGVVAARGLEENRLAADLVAQPPRMGALLRALAESRPGIEAKSRASGTAS